MKSHKKRRYNAVAIAHRRKAAERAVIRSLSALGVTIGACMQVIAIRHDRTLTPQQKALKIMDIAIETAHATTKALTFKF